VSAADETLARIETLLAQLEAARERLSADDAEHAVDTFSELDDLAKELLAQIEQARRELIADAGS
jgi:hypothetical protein